MGVHVSSVNAKDNAPTVVKLSCDGSEEENNEHQKQEQPHLRLVHGYLWRLPCYTNERPRNKPHLLKLTTDFKRIQCADRVTKQQKRLLAVPFSHDEQRIRATKAVLPRKGPRATAAAIAAQVSYTSRGSASFALARVP
jgi:hypothetical protein